MVEAWLRGTWLTERRRGDCRPEWEAGREAVIGVDQKHLNAVVGRQPVQRPTPHPPLFPSVRTASSRGLLRLLKQKRFRWDDGRIF